jgi:LPS sulfotransferase NodH
VSKPYHSLMRAIGLTGPHKFKSAPEMEYWGSNSVDKTDRFDSEIRMPDRLPYQAMVYRSTGDCCIGVFTDKINPDYKAGPDGELRDLLALALPYVEDAEKDPAYKAGVVRKLAERIREAIQ